MPKLIVIEGANGSGKTTQAQRLTTYLFDQGLYATYVHEPYGKIGRFIDENKRFFDSRQLALLYTAARSDFLSVMWDNDRYKDFVFVLDRWVPSTLIYNKLIFSVPRDEDFLESTSTRMARVKAGARILENAEVVEFYRDRLHTLDERDMRADWMIVLDAPYDRCLERIANRERADCVHVIRTFPYAWEWYHRAEGEKIFKECSKTAPVRIETGDEKADVVFEKVKAEVDRMLELKALKT